MPSDLSDSENAANVELKLVDDSTGSGAVPEVETGPADSDSQRRRGLPIWACILGLLAFAVVMGWQLQVASELEAEVARVEAELSRANLLIDAHRMHLAEIRGGVHELSA